MIKIVALIVVCAVLVVYVKNVNAELYPLVLLGSGIIVLYTGFTYLTGTLDFFKKIVSASAINEKFLSIIFKIVSVGYIVEFGAGVVEDMGLKSLADKLVFIGKAIIVGVSLPVFYAVIETVNALL
ncbi:MAG: stage III sporulation AC/AD family protein [Candidatus Borkfalkiaceae bacterium]|nr:stage III sporulation AC/AD family protein [Christensenellaceae bacterium]